MTLDLLCCCALLNGYFTFSETSLVKFCRIIALRLIIFDKKKWLKRILLVLRNETRQAGPVKLNLLCFFLMYYSETLLSAPTGCVL